VISNSLSAFVLTAYFVNTGWKVSAKDAVLYATGRYDRTFNDISSSVSQALNLGHFIASWPYYFRRNPGLQLIIAPMVKNRGKYNANVSKPKTYPPTHNYKIKLHARHLLSRFPSTIPILPVKSLR
jgi:hypothetical protein